jgi:DNA invertase Pin-like site-specific DNA recombinase
MNKTVALYIRVSTADKQIKGMQSQEQALMAYCHNHNLKDIAVYKDQVSGGRMDRPELQRLQKDIFLGRINLVVCWKLDRLSRCMRDGINLLVDWLQMGIQVISVAQQFDFSGVVGKLVASVLLGIAEMERANIRENIIRGMQAARGRGVKIGGKEPKIHCGVIRQFQDKGLKMTEIAKELRCSRQALYDAIKRGKQTLQVALQ